LNDDYEYTARSTRPRKKLLSLEEARADAWIRKNRETLDALYAPDFMEINYYGRLDAGDLMDCLFPLLTMRPLTIEEPRFLHAGIDAAALTYRCREDLTVNGEQITGIFHVTALYTRINNDWRLLLWQITPWKHHLDESVPA